MNDCMPQVFGGLQRGKILARGSFALMKPAITYDINVNDVDCVSQVSIDLVFDTPATKPVSGDLVMYRKSMILRGTELGPVNYCPGVVLPFATVNIASLFSIKPGVSFGVSTGIESVGFCHNFADALGPIDIENLYYVIRIVDQTVTQIRKE